LSDNNWQKEEADDQEIDSGNHIDCRSLYDGKVPGRRQIGDKVLIGANAGSYYAKYTGNHYGY